MKRELKRVAPREGKVPGELLGEYQGIRISHLNLGGAQKQAVFLTITRDALAFIEKHDPRRFATVHTHLGCIVNRITATGGAQYDTEPRGMSIDADGCDFDPTSKYYEWQTARYASTIIHEATHGRLVSQGIPYTNENAIRVERLCRTEEKRFAARLPRTGYFATNELVGDVDEEFYRQYFQWKPRDHHRKIFQKMFKRLTQTGDAKTNAGGWLVIGICGLGVLLFSFPLLMGRLAAMTAMTAMTATDANSQRRRCRVGFVLALAAGLLAVGYFATGRGKAEAPRVRKRGVAMVIIRGKEYAGQEGNFVR